MLGPLLEDAGIGICIKDAAGRVLDQNPACRAICGDRTQRVCEDGCMALRAADPERRAEKWGCSVYRNSCVHQRECDVSLLCSGERIVTFLQPLARRYEPALEHYRDAALTRRETEIAELLIRGRSNAQICRQTGIAHSTLRTHLNHIYRKLRDRGSAPRCVPQRRISTR